MPGNSDKTQSKSDSTDKINTNETKEKSQRSGHRGMQAAKGEERPKINADIYFRVLETFRKNIGIYKDLAYKERKQTPKVPQIKMNYSILKAINICLECPYGQRNIAKRHKHDHICSSSNLSRTNSRKKLS